MAEQQRPSDRIISNVNTNTNGQIGDLKKYVAGVDPHISGPKNPDGTFSKTIAKNTQTQTQTSLEQNKEKQQMGVFQLLSRGIQLIKDLLDKIIKKLQPILDSKNQQRFIDELVRKISPELFGKIKIEPIQLKTFFTNITTISNSLTGLINSQDKLSSTLTTLNTTFADKFIPQFQNIDITSAISDKITGTFDVASAINSRIANETFSVASAINSKITDDKFNIASAINSKITDDTFNAASAINSKIVGEDFNVAKAIDSRITDDTFNVADAISDKITGTFDVSTIITSELLQSQIKEVFDTINLTVIDTFNFSNISEKLENKINDVIENINVSSIKTERSSEVPPSSRAVPPTSTTTLSSEINRDGESEKKRELLEDKIENIKKALELSLNNVFAEFLGKSQWIQDDVLPNIQYTLDESITKISKSIDDKLSNILNKLENIDNKIKPISEETTKEVADKKDNINTQLEKIANSIVGKKDDSLLKGNASYTNDKGEKVLKLFAFTNKDVKTLRESQAEIIKAQANLDEVEDADKFGENIKQADRITANILKEKSAFDNLAKFDKLLQTLEENANIKIDPKNLPKTRTERILRIVKTMNPNTLSQKQLNRIASTLNKLNNNRAFNPDGKTVDKLTLTNKFGDDSKLIKDSLLSLKKDISNSKNPILNEKASKLDKLHFFNDKAKAVTSKGQRVDEIVKQVVNKPLNFSLRNFLTSNDKYLNLLSVINSKVGKKIEGLIEEVSKLKPEKEEAPVEEPSKKEEGKEKKRFFSFLKGKRKGAEESSGKSGNLLGAAKGAGLLAGLGGIGATVGTMAAGTAVIGALGLGAYGAYKSKDWEQKAQLNGAGEVSKPIQYIAGGTAMLDHVAGRGMLDRINSAWKRKSWSRLWGSGNEMLDEYTQEERYAKLAHGDDFARQMQEKRFKEYTDKNVKSLRESNEFASQRKTADELIQNLDTKIDIKIPKTFEEYMTNSSLRDNSVSKAPETLETIQKRQNNIQSKQNLLELKQKNLSLEGTQLGTGWFIDQIEDDKLDRKGKHNAHKIFNNLVYGKEENVPLSIKLQRELIKNPNYLNRLSPDEFQKWKDKIEEDYAETLNTSDKWDHLVKENGKGEELLPPWDFKQFVLRPHISYLRDLLLDLENGREDIYDAKVQEDVNRIREQNAQQKANRLPQVITPPSNDTVTQSVENTVQTEKETFSKLGVYERLSEPFFPSTKEPWYQQKQDKTSKYYFNFWMPKESSNVPISRNK